MAEHKDLGFKVADHRMFNPDGTLREREEESKAPVETLSGPPEETGGPARDASLTGEGAKNPKPATAAPNRSPVTATPEWSVPTGQRGPASGAFGLSDDLSPLTEPNLPESDQLPQPSFVGLVNMLAVEAAMHLGLVQNPMGGASVDLESAKHMIDLLGILQDKSRGNLARDEEDLLEGALTDLRMQFVAMTRRR